MKGRSAWSEFVKTRPFYDWIPARSTREWQPFVLLF